MPVLNIRANCLNKKITGTQANDAPTALPREIAITYANDLNDQQNKLVTNGMETLANMLDSAIQGLDDETEYYKCGCLNNQGGQN